MGGGGGGGGGAGGAISSCIWAQIRLVSTRAGKHAGAPGRPQ